MPSSRRWVVVGSFLTVAAAVGIVFVLWSKLYSEDATYYTNVPIAEDVKAVATSSNEFAFDLYQPLRGEPGNLFFSPVSITTALSMAQAGAAGETRE